MGEKNKMKKKIMILGASILQLPAIRMAKKMGVSVVVVDYDQTAIGFKEGEIEKEFISTIDIPNVVLAAKKHKIDGIMTLATDFPVRTIAAVSKEMGLVGIDEATAIRATNKYEMRKALKQFGVPVPNFSRAATIEDFNISIESFVPPFIVKPADNSGSRGVILVEDISKAKAAFEYSASNSRSGEVVIEEYMKGPEVSVETLTIDGVCHVIQITDKLTTGSPHFVEMGHSQPSRLDNNTQKKIREVAIAANKAIGINNGPSHTEIIVTSEGPKIVELGARLGGDCITTSLVPLSTGIDMVECCIRIALGEKVTLKTCSNKGSAIRYFHQTNGHVKDISGIDNALNICGIKEVVCMVKKGDMVNTVTDSGSRIGYVIAQDQTAELAIKDCETALERIHIQLIK